MHVNYNCNYINGVDLRTLKTDIIAFVLFLTKSINSLYSYN